MLLIAAAKAIKLEELIDKYRMTKEKRIEVPHLVKTR
jgi:hypothetical protein